ncbi:MAG: DUF2085 domain-containing protein [Acidobacteria bacterium]|nr:DUF2085 domain-containing protein [Acidobacteriota bacterium]MCA1607878.1 DUF2085 domain-containing protein [Acidobacteriota bacterium]
MPESAEIYVPQDVYARLRRRAKNVWLWTLSITVIWMMAIVVAPIFTIGPVYSFFSHVCHQIPERSLFLGDHPFAVCSRCFGVYAGLLSGVIAYPLWRQIDETESLNKLWLFLALIPIGIDWTLGVFGVWENNHVSRVLTGAILGAACATYIVPAIFEIARNRLLKNHRKFARA